MEPTKDITTEQAILDAAERLFLEKGFSLTSTTEIAKKAGCNQALVHYYFRTKDKLFEAIFNKKLRVFFSTLLQIDDKDIPFEERLRQKIELHFEMLQANPRLPFLLFNELITNPQRIQAIKEKIDNLPKSIFTQLKTELQEEVDKGTFRPMDPFDLILTIFSLNVTLFLVSPIVKTTFNISDEELQKIIERRKSENVNIILNSLRP